MATNFSPCKGSYVLNQFPSNVMFGMNGFHVSASGAIQGHHGPLVSCSNNVFKSASYTGLLKVMIVWYRVRCDEKLTFYNYHGIIPQLGLTGLTILIQNKVG